MSGYDGQFPGEIVTATGEPEGLLFTEADHRNALRFLNEEPAARHDVGQLLERLSSLATDGNSHRAQFLLSKVVEVLPGTPEGIASFVAQRQVTDQSGLAVGYDHAVGMIHQVQGQEV